MDPDLICHHLNVNPMVTPRKQPPRHSSKEHSKAVKEEGEKKLGQFLYKGLCLGNCMLMVQPIKEDLEWV